MAKITVEFTGQSEDLSYLRFALFETAAVEAGTQKEIPGGGTLTMQPFTKHKAYGIPQYIEIVLSTGDSVAAGIASNYIYDTLKKHKSKHPTIRINRRAVQFDKAKLTAMVRNELSTTRQ